MELKSLENEVLSILSKSEDEKMLVKCQKILRYLEKLFHFTLTPEEFDEYRELTGDVSSPNALIPAFAGTDQVDSRLRGNDTRFGIEHLTGFLNKKIV